MSLKRKTRHFHAGKLRKTVGGVEFVEVAESKGKVFVSEDGRVLRNGKVYRGNDNGHRYLSTNVCGRTTYVHRIIYEVFVEEIPCGMEIDHINNVRDDNRASNLRAVTHYANLTENPLSIKCRRDASRKTIKRAQEAQEIPVVAIDADFNRYWFKSGSEAARVTGTHFTSISQVLTHSRGMRIAGGFKWRYATDTDRRMSVPFSPDAVKFVRGGRRADNV